MDKNLNRNSPYQLKPRRNIRYRDYNNTNSMLAALQRRQLGNESSTETDKTLDQDQLEQNY